MAEMLPLPVRPTNSDLAKGIEQIHACFETFRNINSQDLQIITKAIEQNRDITTGIESTVDIICTNQKLIANALSVDTHKNEQPKNLLLMPQKEALTKMAIAAGGGLGAIFAIWKFIGISWPFVWSLLKALNKSILG